MDLHQLVSLPSHAIGVYRVNTRSNGSLQCYKGRLVARGFQQEYGRDFDHTFAPDARMTPILILLVVASVRQWFVSKFDVKNVFIDGEVCEEVCKKPYLGYSAACSS